MTGSISKFEKILGTKILNAQRKLEELKSSTNDNENIKLSTWTVRNEWWNLRLENRITLKASLWKFLLGVKTWIWFGLTSKNKKKLWQFSENVRKNCGKIEEGVKVEFLAWCKHLNSTIIPHPLYPSPKENRLLTKHQKGWNAKKMKRRIFEEMVDNFLWFCTAGDTGKSFRTLIKDVNWNGIFDRWPTSDFDNRSVTPRPDHYLCKSI